MRAEKDWSKVKATNTTGAYEEFLSKHPQTKKAKQANEGLEALRYEQAKAIDSIIAYESYMKHHLDGSGVEDVRNRLRELRYIDARQRRTISAFRSFFDRYDKGADVDTLIAELPAIRGIEKAWKTARRNNTVDSYKDYLTDYPEGDHSKEARARIQIHEFHSPKEARARIWIRDFHSGFGITTEFTEKQVRAYLKGLENETYSTFTKEALKYYIIEGCDRCTPTKRSVVVQPNQKACSIQLEAGNLSITAVYISVPPGSSITRPLFPEKYHHTMTHNGNAGPGLEIDLPSDRRIEFKIFLDTFSIAYRVMYSTKGSTMGYVIADLLWSSHFDDNPLPHLGCEFTIKHENRNIVFKTEGVEGMPDTPITNYKQALALKTYLKTVDNKTGTLLDLANGQLYSSDHKLEELSWALENGNINKARELIKDGIDVNTKINGGATPLEHAIWRHDYNMVKMLLKENADVNVNNQHGITPLLATSMYPLSDYIKIMKLLLEANADVNASTPDGRTPLIFAADYDNTNGYVEDFSVETVKLLLAANADVNVSDKDGATELWIACKNRQAKVVKMLLEKGADFSVEYKGYTALEISKKEEYWDIVDLLKNAGAKR